MSRFLQVHVPLASHVLSIDPVRLQLQSSKKKIKRNIKSFEHELLLPLQTPSDCLKYPFSQVSHLSPAYPILQVHFPVSLHVVFSFVPIA